MDPSGAGLYYLFIFMTRNSSSNSDDDSLLDAFSALRVTHQQQLTALLRQQQQEQLDLAASAASLPPALSSRSSPADRSLPYRGVRPNTALDHPLSFNGLPIHIGDRVVLRTTAKSGRKGDKAKVTDKAADRQWITICLRKTRTTTTRCPRNLGVITPF